MSAVSNQQTEQATGIQRHTGVVTPQALLPARVNRLYSAMLEHRMMLEHLAATKAERSPLNGNELTRGSEATLAGAIVDLLPEDILLLSGRNVSGAAMKGMPLRDVIPALGEHNLEAHHNAFGNRNIFLLSEEEDLCTAAIARAKFLNQGRVIMAVSSREFSTSQKDLLPAVGAQKLPVVFVTPGAIEDSNRTTFKDALPVIAVDRDDAIAIDRVCQEATRRARQGHGPALIECADFAGVDGSRRDPISILEDYMKQRRVWSDEWKRDLVRRFQAELNAS